MGVGAPGLLTLDPSRHTELVLIRELHIFLNVFFYFMFIYILSAWCVLTMYVPGAHRAEGGCWIPEVKNGCELPCGVLGTEPGSSKWS